MVLVLIAMAILLSSGWTFPIRQPISFNHKIHAENEIECSTCHQLFETHISSGKPDLETCTTCHEEALTESKEELKLVEYIEAEEEIPWRRLNRLPDDVFFSHRRHVMVGKIECKTCHGDLGERSSPPTRPLIKKTMDMCIDCHREMEVTEDCISCHR
jgi:predicted CXXCH cytochrome family protein